jgi:hypothetical protein
MAAAYNAPLTAAYARMKAALFRPFDANTWFVVGFASWIAGWGAGNGYSFRLPGGRPSGRDAAHDGVIESVFAAMADLWADPFLRTVLIVTMIVAVPLGLLIMWINSRAEFVFLDAVLHRRRAIAKPWREWAREGNSLFVWRLVFSLCLFAIFLIVAGGSLFVATGGRIPHAVRDVPWVWLLVGFSVVWLPVAVASLYVHTFLRHFIVPIMYRDHVTTSQAWRTFRPMLEARFVELVLYGLFLVGLHILLFLALIPAICVTCCLLGCLMIIPYIGAVVWLPVSYSLRAFGPEFLAQFGPQWSVWPQAE